MTEHIDQVCLVAKKRLDIMKMLKYKLGRKSLEIFYFSFVRSVLEYGDVLFAGASSKDLNKINKIEIDAKRIITGATARSNIALLNIEIPWDCIEKRRSNHLLLMLYRIRKGDAPKHLINILEDLSNNNQNYNLRNHNMRIPYCKTQQYKKSFFPMSINVWNSLPMRAKIKPSIMSFKSYLKRNEKSKKNVLYCYGKRENAIHHARLRMGCSLLNGHLNKMLHVIDNPRCECGFHIESPKHYFLECPRYAGPRVSLIEGINQLTDCNVNVILFGDRKLNLENNLLIFQSVHDYMKETKRFMK